jgi:excisionase family DNA binding protein
MEADFTPPYMTVEQVAKYLQISVTSVWRFKREGKIKGYRIPGTRMIRYRRKEIEKVMERALT